MKMKNIYNYETKRKKIIDLDKYVISYMTFIDSENNKFNIELVHTEDEIGYMISLFRTWEAEKEDFINKDGKYYKHTINGVFEKEVQNKTIILL